LEMAACGFGASGLKHVHLNSSIIGPKLSILAPFHGLKTPKTIRFGGMVLLRRENNGTTNCRSLKSENDSSAQLEDDSKGTVSSDAVRTLLPNSLEVESLLKTVCDTTSIAELELKLGGFRLHVRRSLTEQGLPLQLPSPAPVVAHSVVAATPANGSASSTSLAIANAGPSSDGARSFLDKASDEGLTILQSPRVGFFRRSRTIKGKRAPPSCKEKDTVKEGQVLCFIEQLGGEIPVESDTSGEVVKILKDEG
ncbi:hypothetical protein M569_11347, partial [Genlisea aurea]